MNRPAVLCLTLLSSVSLQAQLFVNQFTVNQAIPDENLSGYSDTRTLSIPQTEILSVSVTLNITALNSAGANNGDLYVSLSHGGFKSVLLNGVGRTALNSVGYQDSGFSNVVLSDDAANGDIHNYRLTLSGEAGHPLSGPLTGEWAPDGRDVQPGNSKDTTPRTALLSSFQGSDPNGAWTLQVVDSSAGGLAYLQGWTLSIAASTPIETPVPEPVETSVVMAALLGGFAFWKTRSGRVA